MEQFFPSSFFLIRIMPHGAIFFFFISNKNHKKWCNFLYLNCFTWQNYTTWHNFKFFRTKSLQPLDDEEFLPTSKMKKTKVPKSRTPTSEKTKKTSKKKSKEEVEESPTTTTVTTTVEEPKGTFYFCAIYIFRFYTII